MLSILLHCKLSTLQLGTTLSSLIYLCIIHLLQVAEEYKLVPDTLYYTISYIDRFLSTNVVPRQRLQLLGVSCMLIAA